MKETTRGRQCSRVNRVRDIARSALIGAIPVNIGVRSPPLIVHSSRDSIHVSASLHAVFVFVHFRFVDREGRQTVVVNVLPLPTGWSPPFPQWVVTSAPCCRPIQDLRDMRYIISLCSLFRAIWGELEAKLLAVRGLGKTSQGGPIP